MTHVNRRWLAVAIAAFALTVSACGERSCNCPNDVGVAQIPVPSTLSAPLVSVKTSSDFCSATILGGDAATSVDVAAGTSSCEVVGTLADGHQIEATVEFRPVSLACGCGTFEQTGATPSFMPFDGGAG
jgi:hypothetical protein